MEVGLIDAVGGLAQVVAKLRELIDARKLPIKIKKRFGRGVACAADQKT